MQVYFAEHNSTAKPCCMWAKYGFGAGLMSAAYSRSAEREVRSDEATAFSMGQNMAVDANAAPVLLEWSQRRYSLHRPLRLSHCHALRLQSLGGSPTKLQCVRRP
jgi:hypothetical protein